LADWQDDRSLIIGLVLVHLNFGIPAQAQSPDGQSQMAVGSILDFGVGFIPGANS
jgi:hypothetical protein